MRWGHKESLDGVTRIRRIFLWRPRYDSELNETRWLEYATIKETYYACIGEWELTKFLE
jgi:hypothetical protein